jgi:hypothetical protein
MNNIRLSIEDLELISKIKYKLQSLQQPKYPVAFECEMELYDEGGFSPERKPKTITNSQGLTQVVGKYIY